MKITEQAAVELKKVLSGFEPGMGIHIYSTAGCCGPSIQMDIAGQAATNETVVNMDDIDFFVDNNILPTLDGVTIEHSSNGFRLSGLKQNSGGCCG